MFHLKMELPNGQAGKLAAYETATGLVVNVISAISDDVELNPGSGGGGGGGRRRSSALDTPGVTPKRGGRKSISFSHTPAAKNGGGGGSGSGGGDTPRGSGNDVIQMAPPSLKKIITPRRARRNSTVGSNASHDGAGPLGAQHPILSVIVGLLQRILTTKGLERAESRSRVCDFGMSCLAALPPMERSTLIKFVGNMCASKVSCHRLLGVELIGEILCRGWFWKDPENTRGVVTGGAMFKTPFDGSLDESSDGDARRSGGESVSDGSPSAVLLTALEGRLTDKSPTVRTRAAMSLSDVARKACSAREENRNLDGTVIAGGAPNLKSTSRDDEAATIPSRALTVALCRIGGNLVEALRRRASTDERASVRKSAILAWLQMLQLARRENREEFQVSGLDM